MPWASSSSLLLLLLAAAALASRDNFRAASRDVLIKDYPFVVSVGYVEDSYYLLKCAGTILDKYHILTSAHCYDNTSAATSYLVRAGSDLWRYDGQRGAERPRARQVRPGQLGVRRGRAAAGHAARHEGQAGARRGAGGRGRRHGHAPRRRPGLGLLQAGRVGHQAAGPAHRHAAHHRRRGLRQGVQGPGEGGDGGVLLRGGHVLRGRGRRPRRRPQDQAPGRRRVLGLRLRRRAAAHAARVRLPGRPRRAALHRRAAQAVSRSSIRRRPSRSPRPRRAKDTL